MTCANANANARAGRTERLEFVAPRESPRQPTPARDVAAAVFVVGDVRVHREGLALLLAHEGRLHVAGCSDSTAASSSVPADVDVVLVAADTRANVGRIAAASGAALVLLGVPDDEADVVAFAEAGVLGFVERGSTVDQLAAGIEAVARGETICPPRVAAALLSRLALLAQRRGEPPDSALTARERQVVELIDDGLSNKEIAARLCIEVATVKNHVHNILEKLQVSRRGEAAARLRLVEGDGPGVARIHPLLPSAVDRRA
jgi:two-component system, NarL family, nitrate/nitrite response regulator NarL